VFGFGWIPEGAVILDIYGLFLSFSLHQSFQDLCRMMRQQPNHTSNSVTANKSTTDGSSIGANLKVTAPVPTTADREQALRNYKLTIEYKSLKQNAPGGVFLVPSLDDIRTFHGFIIIRRGMYSGGIFKFQLQVPPNYNDKNAWPQITFTTFVYNPLVDPVTWELDIKSEFPTWDPQTHYLVTVLTYLKKIFYTKDWNTSSAYLNLEAKSLAINNPPQFRKMVEQCVEQSKLTIYDNLKGSTAVFVEEKPEHSNFRTLLKTKIHDTAAVSRNAILDLIEESKNVLP